MKKPLILSSILFIFVIVGCGKEIVIINPGSENSGQVSASRPEVDNATASSQHLQQAKMFYARDKFKQAMQHCEKAIEFDNRNWEAYYYMGLIMQNRKEYAQSIETFSDGLKFAPDSKLVKAELHCALGYSWENLGKFEEARTQYNLALSLNPQNESARKGKNRIEVEKTLKNWGKDKKINYEG